MQKVLYLIRSILRQNGRIIIIIIMTESSLLLMKVITSGQATVSSVYIHYFTCDGNIGLIYLPDIQNVTGEKIDITPSLQNMHNKYRWNY